MYINMCLFGLGVMLCVVYYVVWCCNNISNYINVPKSTEYVICVKVN